MKRKAQLTVFILVGIILILAVLGGTYLFQQSSEQENLGERTGYDEAVAPIANQIRSCAQTLTEERVRDLTNQGGLTDEELADRTTSLPRETYRLEGVDYYEDGALTIPYWYKSDDTPDCGDCSLTTDIPDLTGPNSIQSKTESYIENNIASCVQDFNDFREYDVDTETLPEATVSFNEADTITTVKWPLTISETTTESSYQEDRFTAQTGLKVRPLYDAATTTLQRIAANNIPSTYAQKILAFNTFSNNIPPVDGGIGIGRANDVWFLNDIKETLQQDLASYSSLIRVIGPDEPQPSFESYDIAQFSRDLISTTPDTTLNDYDVSTTYRPTWPLYLRVNGQTSPVILPESIDFGVSFLRFAFNDQDFDYDMTYPLVFNVQAETTQNQEDPLRMRFGVEGNIRATQSYDTATIGSPNTEPTDQPLFEGLAGNNVSVTIDGPRRSGGSLQLTCAGETITAADNDETTAVIETQLPTCTAGNLSYEATLVQSETKEVRIGPGQQNEYTLNTAELQNTTISLERLPIFDANDPSSNLTYPAQPLTQGQSSINIEDSIEQSFGGSGDITNPNYLPATTSQQPLLRENVTVLLTQDDGNYLTTFDATRSSSEATVELYPGPYNVRVIAQTNLDQPITTEPEEICFDTSPVTETCETIPSESIPGGTEQAVTQCVNQQATNNEYQAYIDAVEQNPDTPVQNIAASQGIDVTSCVDERLANQDLSLLTGYYGSNQTTINIPEGNNTKVIQPYYGYSPDQIQYTRDLTIISAILNMAEKLRDVSEAQPKVTTTQSS